jgi:hypothetical protein
MAGNPECMSADGNQAVFIGTNLDTGDTVTLCPSCLTQFCATIVEAQTGVPVTEFIAIATEPVAEPEPVEQATPVAPESPEATEATEDTAKSLDDADDSPIVTN